MTPNAPSTPRWLLVRRHQQLWGIPHEALAGLEGGEPARVKLQGGVTLWADELLQAVELAVRPFPRCARRFYPQELRGLALWRHQPVLLLEPQALPDCFNADPEEGKR